MTNRKIIALSLVACTISACQSLPESEDATQVHSDQGEGQLYPPITETAVHLTHFNATPSNGPLQRQFVVDLINMETSGTGQSAPIVVQGAGEENRVLVVMIATANRTLTPYTSRALLARMTSVMRFSPAVIEMGLSDDLDIYDLAKVLGFEQIIVTDGHAISYATQIEFEPLPSWSASFQSAPQIGRENW